MAQVRGGLEHTAQVLMAAGVLPPVSLNLLSAPQLRLLYVSTWLRLQAYRRHGRERGESRIIAEAVRLFEQDFDRRGMTLPDCFGIYEQILGRRAASGVS